MPRILSRTSFSKRRFASQSSNASSFSSRSSNGSGRGSSNWRSDASMPSQRGESSSAAPSPSRFGRQRPIIDIRKPTMHGDRSSSSSRTASRGQHSDPLFAMMVSTSKSSGQHQHFQDSAMSASSGGAISVGVTDHSSSLRYRRNNSESSMFQLYGAEQEPDDWGQFIDVAEADQEIIRHSRILSAKNSSLSYHN